MLNEAECLGFLKAAKDGKDEEGSRSVRAATGATGVGVGTALVSGSKRRLTGRVTVFHGTTADRAESIAKEGLKPSGSPGIIAEGGFPKEWGRKAYVTRNRHVAVAYGFNQSAINRGAQVDTAKRKGGLHIPDVEPLDMKNPRHRPAVVEMSAREWGPNGVKLEKNPEILDRKSFVRRTARRLRDMGHPSFGRRDGSFDRDGKDLGDAMREGRKRMQRDAVKGVWKTQQRSAGHAVEGIGPEAVRGGARYERLTVKEIGQYARARPGRFLSGVGLAAAGVGLAAAGVHHALKGKSEKK